jgi:hypothetical protein
MISYVKEKWIEQRDVLSGAVFPVNDGGRVQWPEISRPGIRYLLYGQLLHKALAGLQLPDVGTILRGNRNVVALLRVRVMASFGTHECAHFVRSSALLRYSSAVSNALGNQITRLFAPSSAPCDRRSRAFPHYQIIRGQDCSKLTQDGQVTRNARFLRHPSRSINAFSVVSCRPT